MALQALLRLTGATQGQIKGSITMKGQEGTIAVTAAHHRLTTPYDAATGQTSGRRRHSVYTITKNLDASSTKLATAWVNNEDFTNWELRFFSPSATGVQTNHYTVRLTAARIVALEFTMPDVLDPEQSTRPEQEQVSFTYQAIEWKWTTGALMATDTWA